MKLVLVVVAIVAVWILAGLWFWRAITGAPWPWTLRRYWRAKSQLTAAEADRRGRFIAAAGGVSRAP